MVTLSDTLKQLFLTCWSQFLGTWMMLSQGSPKAIRRIRYLAWFITEAKLRLWNGSKNKFTVGVSTTWGSVLNRHRLGRWRTSALKKSPAPSHNLSYLSCGGAIQLPSVYESVAGVDNTVTLSLPHWLIRSLKLPVGHLSFYFMDCLLFFFAESLPHLESRLLG